MRTATCRYHCAACGRHFASEAAFDGHRIGDHSLPPGDPEGRRCNAPIDDERQRYGSEVGVCRAYETVVGVAIYFLAEAREKAREHFGAVA